MHRQSLQSARGCAAGGVPHNPILKPSQFQCTIFTCTQTYFRFCMHQLIKSLAPSCLRECTRHFPIERRCHPDLASSLGQIWTVRFRYGPANQVTRDSSACTIVCVHTDARALCTTLGNRTSLCAARCCARPKLVHPPLIKMRAIKKIHTVMLPKNEESEVNAQISLCAARCCVGPKLVHLP